MSLYGYRIFPVSLDLFHYSTSLILSSHTIEKLSFNSCTYMFNSSVYA